jgi:hypothetical protein
MRVLAATVLLAGCGYQSGSFDSPVRQFSGSLITVDCLDIAIDRRPDLPDGHAVVSYTFGNRCDHPVLIDLSQVAILGRDWEGKSFELAAYDPRHEIEALRIDGRAVGGEAIAYERDESPKQICIDAGGITHAPTAAWLCIGSRPLLTEVP